MFQKKLLCQTMLKLLLALFAFSVISANATNLGIYGETYPILEEDFLDFIQNRIKTLQQNGEWQKLQNKMQEKVKPHADRPFPINNISKTIHPKEWLFDPSIILTTDLKDNHGQVFAKRGTVFNPLSMVSLRTPLLFIDADDSKQIEWAKYKTKNLEKPIKLILIKGAISNTEKIFKQRIYFDQAGRLTSHFNIQHVPAIIIQEDMQLKISEEVV